MGDAIDIKFNDKKAKKFFADITRGTNAVKKRNKAFWGAITAPAMQDVINHFEKEKGPDGKWKAWSPLYAKKRGAGKILALSGNLRQQNRPATSSAERKKGILIINPAKTKSGFPYAFAHNKGGSKLPKREFMWLSDKAMGKIGKLTLAFMLGAKK